MKVVVDEDKCVAAGQCVAAAMDVFDQRDEDGIVVLLDENPCGRTGRRRTERRGGVPRAGDPYRGIAPSRVPSTRIPPTPTLIWRNDHVRGRDGTRRP